MKKYQDMLSKYQWYSPLCLRKLAIPVDVITKALITNSPMHQSKCFMTFVHILVSTALYLPISWSITAWVKVLEVYYYAAYISNIFLNWFFTCIYATILSLCNRNVKFASVCERAVPCTAATPLLWTIYEHKTLSENVCGLMLKTWAGS